MRLAQGTTPLYPPGGFQGPGEIGLLPGNDAPATLDTVISTAIGVMTVVAFIWFTIQFFIAAVQIIGSSGDKAALEAARGKIQSSVLGIVVVVSAIFFIQLIGTIFGFDILNAVTDLITTVGA